LSEDILSLNDTATYDFIGGTAESEDILSLLDTALISAIRNLISEDALAFSDTTIVDTIRKTLSEDLLDLSDTALLEAIIRAVSEDVLNLDDTATFDVILKAISTDVLDLSDTAIVDAIISALSEDLLDLSDTALLEAIIKAVSEDLLDLSDTALLEVTIKAVSEDVLGLSDTASAEVTFDVSAEDILAFLTPTPPTITTPLWWPTRSDFGVHIDQHRILKYTDVIGNPNAFSFVVRVYPRYNASDSLATDRTLFKYYSLSVPTDSIELYFDESDSDWVFYWRNQAGGSVVLRTSDLQRFQSDNFIELSGWIETDGRDIDGTTYYGKFFVNGVEVDSSTSSLSPQSTNPDTLFIGSNGTSEWSNCIIDEVAFFARALVDDEIIRIFTNGNPLLNINGAWSLNYTLSIGDFVSYNAATGEVELFDGSQTSHIEHLAGGRNPSIKGKLNEEATLYFPVDINEVTVIFRPHWR